MFLQIRVLKLKFSEAALALDLNSVFIHFVGETKSILDTRVNVLRHFVNILRRINSFGDETD